MSEWAAKRFWTTTETVEVSGGYGIALDGRAVKTPAKAPLVLPTAAMAAAVAQEWDAQTGKIDPGTMPVTRGANAAIDKVATQKDEVVTRCQSSLEIRSPAPLIISSYTQTRSCLLA